MVLAKNFTLTPSQASLLKKGLTFIPAPIMTTNSKQQLAYDLQTYHRKIKLASYFGDDQHSPVPFLPPSDWTPKPTDIPQAIHDLIKLDIKTFSTLPTQEDPKQNITPEETIALKQLINNRHIIIKPADKGSTIVIMDKEQYLFEGNKQLNNQEYYTKLVQPIYPNTAIEIKKILQDLKIKKFINHKQYTYLLGNPIIRPRQFYLLPKIHKDPSTWTIPHEIPPGRPIVSDIDSESYRTAEYLEHFLTPISTQHKSYIKDTYHFIDTIKNITIPATAYLFTMDVNSLYTNIETPSGLTAVKQYFNKYPNKNRPDKELLKLLEINLTCNDFQFNTDTYLQLKGTAMGKKFAPAYANIFMAVWEEEALTKCDKQPLHYFRYLDDIFGIWTHTPQDFEQFTNILNNHNPSIQLKAQLEHNNIHFLDTTTYKGPTFHNTGKLDIKVYFKDTDTHALLYKTSYHPKHTFRGLVKSQLLRFHRICTQPKDFTSATKILFKALKERNYSRPFLRNCYKTFLDTKARSVDAIIPLITTFTPRSRQLNRIIKKNFKTKLQDHGQLTNYKVITAHRRNKNLRDYLVKAKIKPSQLPKRKPETEFFVKTNWIYNANNSQIFPIQKDITPNTTNCIYLIWCHTCKMKYVGETGNAIATRLTQHKYNIKNRKSTHLPVIQHFIDHGLPQLRYTGIHHNPTWTTQQRQKEERKWIYKLNTKQPLGLNLR
ncbi:hypothetical protein ACEWY4_027991 [Coilia grayii]|uniref:Reverse transcriptase domain-containing protein n=1 Tax=Coilia grayii TaxID=363190 RepID=A0ABD1IN27_9TELE